MNFLGEKHAKNARDTHFSCIAKFIHNESLVRQLNSSKHIVDTIHSTQTQSNENRALKSNKFIYFIIYKIIDSSKLYFIDKPPINTIAFELKSDTLEILNIANCFNEKLTIKNIERFYNYRTIGNDFKCMTSVLSGRDSYMPINIPSIIYYLSVYYLK